ncbi:hypothetical protein [Paraoerskovia sediminicola]|nr:hypothetical protein [Paraoerskovia sediminicola]
MVALLVYLIAVARIALDYGHDRWVVQGGWIGVRALGLVTVVMAALLLNRYLDLRRRRQDPSAGAATDGAADDGTGSDMDGSAVAGGAGSGAAADGVVAQPPAVRGSSGTWCSGGSSAGRP